MFDSNNYIKYIGFGFLLLGYYYYFDYLKLDQFTIFSFTIAAFSFVLVDSLEYKLNIERERLKKNNGVNHRRVKFYDYSRRISGALGITFIVVVPHFNPNWNEAFIDKLSNTSLLVGLGLTILLIGYRSDKSILELVEHIQQQLQQIQEVIKNKKDKHENK
jgi:hypothetical protein